MKNMSAHASRAGSGRTTLEIIAAALIFSMAAVSVFSIRVSNSLPRQNTDKKAQAAMLVKNAQQTLQAFASAEPGDPEYANGAGGRWAADTSNRWALAEGRHDISSLMNGTSLQARDDKGAPVPCAYDANCTGNCCYLTYMVIDDNSKACAGISGAGNACKTVVFKIQY